MFTSSCDLGNLRPWESRTEVHGASISSSRCNVAPLFVPSFVFPAFLPSFLPPFLPSFLPYFFPSAQDETQISSCRGGLKGSDSASLELKSAAREFNPKGSCGKCDSRGDTAPCATLSFFAGFTNRSACAVLPVSGIQQDTTSP